MSKIFSELIAMDFPERLSFLRKQKNLTQQALADLIGIHVTQLRRYEAGTSQPTLDVLRKLAVALSVSADVLLFDHQERQPDDDLKWHFEAASQLNDEEKKMVKTLLEGLLIKHHAKTVLSQH